MNTFFSHYRRQYVADVRGGIDRLRGRCLISQSAREARVAMLTHTPVRARDAAAYSVSHTREKEGNKEKALATSNAATVSACAPRYVSQGRHVRLRTTYLYPRSFVRDRLAVRTFPSVEIGRHRVESQCSPRADPFPSAVRELR